MLKVKIPKYNFLNFLVKNLLFSIYADVGIVIIDFIQRLIGGQLSTFLSRTKDNYLFFLIVPFLFVIWTFYEVNIKLEFMYNDNEIMIKKNKKVYHIPVANMINIETDEFGYERIGVCRLKITYKNKISKKQFLVQ